MSAWRREASSETEALSRVSALIRDVVRSLLSTYACIETWDGAVVTHLVACPALPRISSTFMPKAAKRTA
jgi:hypothetical protein